MSAAAIVLAAGMSQRMGRPKLLLPLGGKPLLARTLDTLFAAQQISPILVVTGHNAEELTPVLQGYNLASINNPHYAAGGMLSSVQAGARALPEDCEAFFLILGDQPLVQPQTLLALLEARQKTGALIVIPTYEGRRGHPVLFAASCAPEILALPADATLKTLIIRRADDVLEVPVPDPAILSDVDTPEDYERALKGN
jgi:molybdenum cofactor cytidylyltransferase